MRPTWENAVLSGGFLLYTIFRLLIATINAQRGKFSTDYSALLARVEFEDWIVSTKLTA